MDTVNSMLKVLQSDDKLSIIPSATTNKGDGAMMDQILLVKPQMPTRRRSSEITKRAFDLYAKEIRKRERGGPV